MLDKYKAGLQDIFNENAKAVNEANKKYIKAYFEQFKTMPNLEFLNIRYELSDFTMNGDYKFKLIPYNIIEAALNKYLFAGYEYEIGDKFQFEVTKSDNLVKGKYLITSVLDKNYFFYYNDIKPSLNIMNSFFGEHVHNVCYNTEKKIRFNNLNCIFLSGISGSISIEGANQIEAKNSRFISKTGFWLFDYITQYLTRGLDMEIGSAEKIKIEKVNTCECLLTDYGTQRMLISNVQNIELINIVNIQILNADCIVDKENYHKGLYLYDYSKKQFDFFSDKYKHKDYVNVEEYYKLHPERNPKAILTNRDKNLASNKNSLNLEAADVVKVICRFTDSFQFEKATQVKIFDHNKNVFYIVGHSRWKNPA
jgi:hypothetical protein